MLCMFILLKFGIPSRQGTKYFIPSRFMYFWLLIFPIKKIWWLLVMLKMYIFITWSQDHTTFCLLRHFKWVVTNFNLSRDLKIITPLILISNCLMIYYILSPPSFRMSYDVEFEDFTTSSIHSEIALTCTWISWYMVWFLWKAKTPLKRGREDCEVAISGSPNVRAVPKSVCC
jgi:hypothetical protein